MKRVARKLKASTQGKEGIESLLEATLGPKTGIHGPSGQLRIFYASNMSALDRFDRLWYSMRFVQGARDWESHFCWSLIHAAVLNCRSAWCALHEQRLQVKAFLSQLIVKYLETIS